MRNRVIRAIEEIERNNWLEKLRQCSIIQERYGKLTELLPETKSWNPILARQLVFYIHHRYEIDLGICPFYSMDDHRQYCSLNEEGKEEEDEDERVECLCIIPQLSCVLRDRNGHQEYPKFMPSLLSFLV